jgi:DNA polymerase-3 subunit gamma/tau
MSQAQLLSIDDHIPTEKGEYHVLARKTRPMTFADVVGQDVLVKVLTNGLKSGRLPHAFIFTGIRGTGKTTTARILARALNCTGRDLKTSPSVDPCGTCANCTSIAQDRHIDVIEMDAASRTGVDDIREVIEAAKYKAVAAQYKVYIIDEVHMLSKSAFNALLKTLEEPPAHVKFIFATTEINKVPKTVLSRCMRFDLRRIDVETLTNHFRSIVQSEGFKIDDQALTLIARAADGSARDGISLLDQALTMCDGTVTNAQVIDMLGLVNRDTTLALLKTTLAGDAPNMLTQVQEMYRNGADPVMVLQDVLDFVHILTSLKVSKEVIRALSLSDTLRQQCAEYAEQLTIPTLTRAWQILLKGLSEVQSAPIPLQACEMILIRLAYASTLPTPEEAIRTMQSDGDGGATPPPTNTNTSIPPAPSSTPTSAQSASVEMASIFETVPATFDSFPALVHYIAEKREPLLVAFLKDDVHLVSFAPGKIIMRLGKEADENMVQRLRKSLNLWFNDQWQVDISQETGEPTLSEQAEQKRMKFEDEVKQDPLIQASLQAFPNAQILSIEPRSTS